MLAFRIRTPFQESRAVTDIGRPQRLPDADRGESHVLDILIALVAVGVLFYLWLERPGIELPIAVAGGSVMVVLSFKRPAVPCVLFIIFSFLRVHEAFPDLTPWKIPQLLAQLSLIVMFWHLVIARSLKPFWTRELTIFAVFFGLTTAGILTSTSWEASYIQWSDVFLKIAIMALLLVWTTRTPGDFHLVARMLTVGGSAVALVAIYNKLNGIGLVEGTRVTIGRATGSVLGDPNDLALALLFPLSFTGALMIGRVGFFDRFIGFVGTGTILMGILFTQSRGGLLGLAAVCAVLGSRLIRSKIFMIGIAVVAVVALFSVADISDRSSGGAGQGIDESSQGRLIAWHTAFNMAVRHPITGVGLSNFAANYWEFTPEWDGKAHAVHSTWFGILAETGFPGIITFVTLVIATALTSWRCVRLVSTRTVDPRLHTAAFALAAGLAGFCVSGTFLTQGFTWPFYIIFALTIALSRTLTAVQEQDAFAPMGVLPPGGRGGS